MGDIRDAILKIVKSDPDIGNAIAAATDPKKIAERRGIAFINDSGGISTREGSEPTGGEEAGAPGAEQEADPEAGDENRNTNAPGSIQGDSGAGGAGSGDTGGADAIHDGAALGKADHSMTGLDGSGNSLEIVFNSTCGVEYEAPTGWESPNSSVDEFGWQAGIVWRHSADSNPNAYQWSSANAIRKATASQTGEPESNIAFRYTHTNPQGEKFYDIDLISPYSPGWGGFCERASCSGVGSASVHCSLTEPTVDDYQTHPSDGVCKIAYDCGGGGWKGHVSDPDCTTCQTTASSAAYMKDSGSGNWYRVTKLTSGGTKTTPVDAPTFDGACALTSGGAPTPGGISVVRDQDGKPIGFYDSVTQVNVQ